MNLRYRLYLKKEKLKRYAKRFNTGSCTVLLYHRVRNTNYDNQQLSVSPQTFQKQLQYLKKSHQFMTVKEFDDCLINRRKFPKNALLISFDDGYADNYQNALPILEQEKLQAIFYISLKNINNNGIFWWDELDEIFHYHEKINTNELNQQIKEQEVKDSKELYQKYLMLLKLAAGLQQRDTLLQKARMLRTLNDNELTTHRCLSNNELIALNASEHAVLGAHTINHLSLAHLTDAEQHYEITTSVTELGRLTGSEIKHFSYPYGEKHNYNQQSLTICKNAGLVHAAANYGGYVDTESNVFSFPRFVVRNDEPELLIKKLKSVL